MTFYPGSHIRTFAFVVGLGFLFVLPIGADALEVDSAIAITEPKNLSQIFDHEPVVRVTIADGAKGAEHAIIIDGEEVVRITPYDNVFFLKLERPLISGLHFLNIKRGSAVYSPQTIFEVLPYPVIPTVETPLENEIARTSRPAVSGVAEAGSTVHIFIDDKKVTSIAQAKNAKTVGNYHFAETVPPLQNGSHSIQARITDRYGTLSGPSEEKLFVTQSTVSAPTLMTPVVNAQTNGRRPWIVGVVQNELTVAVYIDGALDGIIETSPDPSGVANFAYLPKANLTPGEHSIFATAEHALSVSAPSEVVTYRVSGVSIIQELPTVLGESVKAEKGEEVIDEEEGEITEEDEDKDEEEDDKEGGLSERQRTLYTVIAIALLIGLWWAWQKRGGNGGSAGVGVTPSVPKEDKDQKQPPLDQQSFWS